MSEAAEIAIVVVLEDDDYNRYPSHYTMAELIAIGKTFSVGSRRQALFNFIFRQHLVFRLNESKNQKFWMFDRKKSKRIEAVLN